MNRNLCNLHYGFKSIGPTLQCTFTLIENINKHKHNNTDVYVLLLDASQAFGKVNYVKIFQRLVYRKVNRMIIRYLLYGYPNQHLNIQRYCRMSKIFSISNDVK